MADITVTGFVERNPEWVQANERQSDMVAAAVAKANSLPLPYYTDADQEEERRDLEASAILFRKPYGRSMMKSDRRATNPYRVEATRLDRLKGAENHPAAGWPAVRFYTGGS